MSHNHNQPLQWPHFDTLEQAYTHWLAQFGNRHIRYALSSIRVCRQYAVAVTQTHAAFCSAKKRYTCSACKMLTAAISRLHVISWQCTEMPAAAYFMRESDIRLELNTCLRELQGTGTLVEHHYGHHDGLLNQSWQTDQNDFRKLMRRMGTYGAMLADFTLLNAPPTDLMEIHTGLMNLERVNRSRFEGWGFQSSFLRLAIRVVNELLHNPEYMSRPSPSFTPLHPPNIGPSFPQHSAHDPPPPPPPRRPTALDRLAAEANANEYQGRITIPAGAAGAGGTLPAALIADASRKNITVRPTNNPPPDGGNQAYAIQTDEISGVSKSQGHLTQPGAPYWDLVVYSRNPGSATPVEMTRMHFDTEQQRNQMEAWIQLNTH